MLFHTIYEDYKDILKNYASLVNEDLRRVCQKQFHCTLKQIQVEIKNLILLDWSKRHSQEDIMYTTPHVLLSTMLISTFANPYVICR